MCEKLLKVPGCSASFKKQKIKLEYKIGQEQSGDFVPEQAVQSVAPESTGGRLHKVATSPQSFFC